MRDHHITCIVYLIASLPDAPDALKLGIFELIEAAKDMGLKVNLTAVLRRPATPNTQAEPRPGESPKI